MLAGQALVINMFCVLAGQAMVVNVLVYMVVKGILASGPWLLNVYWPGQAMVVNVFGLAGWAMVARGLANGAGQWFSLY